LFVVKMRVLLSLILLTVATAFAPRPTQTKSTTVLALNRRELLTAIPLVVVAPLVANAESHASQNRAGSHTHGSTFFFDEQIENVYEESQQPTGNKLDINGAIVVSCIIVEWVQGSVAITINSNLTLSTLA
jgi:hypothetical protein